MSPGLALPYPWWRRAREVKTLLTHPGEPRGIPRNTRQLTRPARPPQTSPSPAQPGPPSGLPGLAPFSLVAVASSPAARRAFLRAVLRASRAATPSMLLALRFLINTSGHRVSNKASIFTMSRQHVVRFFGESGLLEISFGKGWFHERLAAKRPLVIVHFGSV